MQNDHYYLPLGESENGGRLAICACATVDSARRLSEHVIVRRFNPSRMDRRYRIVEIETRSESVTIPDDPISPPIGAVGFDEQWFTAKELYTRKQGLAIVAGRNVSALHGKRFALVELGRRCSMPFGFIELEANGMGVQERRFSTPVRLVRPTPEEIAHWLHRANARGGLLGFRLTAESSMPVEVMA